MSWGEGGLAVGMLGRWGGEIRKLRNLGKETEVGRQVGRGGKGTWREKG